MSEPTKKLTSRTPVTIAGEINRIKSQTGEILGAALNAARNSCFEIGKRLEEAKCLVPHGEWGKWLSENVDYSESTANNLMRIYREYGGEQIDMITGKSPREIFEGLSQSQLVALFAIPAAERATYVEEHRDELEGGMSVRELQRQLEEYKAEAEAQRGRVERLSAALDEGDRRYDEKLKDIRAENLQKAREEAAEEYEAWRREYEAKALEAGKAAGAAQAEVEKELKAAKKKMAEDEKTIKDLKDKAKKQAEASAEAARAEVEKELKAAKKKMAEDEKTIKDLKDKAKKQAEASAETAGEVESVKAEYERQLRAARAQGNVRAQKVNLYLNDIARLLGAVSAELDAMNTDEPGAGDRMRAKVTVMLGKAMVERGFEG